jgi:hypothetical protein
MNHRKLMPERHDHSAALFNGVICAFSSIRDFAGGK